MRLIGGLCVLLCYQLAGELVAIFFELAIPGPVIGMLLLLATLMVLGRAPAGPDAAAGALLAHLSLLFVPAGVGVMVHLDLVAAEWLPITAALVASTVAGMALTALVMKWVMRLTSRRARP